MVRVQDIATDQIIASYADPELAGPITFRVIVSPMVTWIWIGAVIAIFGALFAAWPASPLRRGERT